MTRERALGHAGPRADETATPWSRYESFPRAMRGGWMLGPWPILSIPSELVEAAKALLWLPSWAVYRTALGGHGAVEHLWRGIDSPARWGVAERSPAERVGRKARPLLSVGHGGHRGRTKRGYCSGFAAGNLRFGSCT